MLAKRIIPCLDVDNGRVMKGIKFQKLEKVGDPVKLADYYNKQNADELVFLDIGASPNKREILYDVVKHVSEKVFIPLTVGGGIRSIKDIQMALSNGADKVSSEKFGSQCIVCAIDARKNRDSWIVLINGGRDRTNIDAVQWAKDVEKYGAGEILLTSWDADGTRKGYDINLTKKIAESVNIPIIASGGAGSLKDILNILTFGRADAALIASLFHYRTYTIKDVKDFLKKNGVEVR